MISFLITCGMFSPRTVESPQVNSSSLKDPFSLNTILMYTGEQFSKTDYEDIFDTNFVFIDFYGQQYDRNLEIQHLKVLGSCKCDSITTVWDTCPGVGEIQGDNTLTLCRSFTVTFFSTSGEATVDSGKAEFKVGRSAENTWTILSWTEEGPQRSIFHP
jgi:hypothetical protein